MPAFADRVKDTSTTTGTGNFTLSGTAPTGFQNFNAAFGTTNPFYYVIELDAEWEVGIGELSAATTLVRTTVLKSSNAGAAVNFSAGTKNVFCDVPAAGMDQKYDIPTPGEFLDDISGVTTAHDVEARAAIIHIRDVLIALGLMDSPIEIFPNAGDNTIRSSDNGTDTYATARNGTGSFIVGTTYILGQWYETSEDPTYLVFQQFYNFDVSGLSADATEVELALAFSADNSGTDFIIQARSHDWGDTLTSADFVAGTALSSLTPLGSVSTTGLTLASYFTLTPDSTNLLSAVNAARVGDGTLRIMVHSQRQDGGVAPSARDTVTISSTSLPRLRITL